MVGRTENRLLQRVRRHARMSTLLRHVQPVSPPAGSASVQRLASGAPAVARATLLPRHISQQLPVVQAAGLPTVVSAAPTGQADADSLPASASSVGAAVEYAERRTEPIQRMAAPPAAVPPTAAPPTTAVRPSFMQPAETPIAPTPQTAPPVQRSPEDSPQLPIPAQSEEGAEEGLEQSWGRLSQIHRRHEEVKATGQTPAAPKADAPWLQRALNTQQGRRVQRTSKPSGRRRGPARAAANPEVRPPMGERPDFADQPAIQREPAAAESPQQTPTESHDESLQGAIGAAEQAQPSLESVWPVQRVDDGADGGSQPPPREIAQVRERNAPEDDPVRDILRQVESGQPTDSHIETLMPRTPRPTLPPRAVQRSESVEPEPASSVEPPAPSTIQREPAAEPPASTMVPTDIGELPSDLWTLLSQPVPGQPDSAAGPNAAVQRTIADIKRSVPKQPDKPTSSARRSANEPTVQRSALDAAIARAEQPAPAAPAEDFSEPEAPVQTEAASAKALPETSTEVVQRQADNPASSTPASEPPVQSPAVSDTELPVEDHADLSGLADGQETVVQRAPATDVEGSVTSSHPSAPPPAINTNPTIVTQSDSGVQRAIAAAETAPTVNKTSAQPQANVADTVTESPQATVPDAPKAESQPAEASDPTIQRAIAAVEAPSVGSPPDTPTSESARASSAEPPVPFSPSPATSQVDVQRAIAAVEAPATPTTPSPTPSPTLANPPLSGGAADAPVVVARAIAAVEAPVGVVERSVERPVVTARLPQTAAMPTFAPTVTPANVALQRSIEAAEQAPIVERPPAAPRPPAPIAWDADVANEVESSTAGSELATAQPQSTTTEAIQRAIAAVEKPTEKPVEEKRIVAPTPNNEVQRAAAAPAPAQQDAAPSSAQNDRAALAAPAASGPATAPASGPDVEALARKVYREIKKRLSIEKERGRGIF